MSGEPPSARDGEMLVGHDSRAREVAEIDPGESRDVSPGGLDQILDAVSAVEIAEGRGLGERVLGAALGEAEQGPLAMEFHVLTAADDLAVEPVLDKRRLGLQRAPCATLAWTTQRTRASR